MRNTVAKSLRALSKNKDGSKNRKRYQLLKKIHKYLPQKKKDAQSGPAVNSTPPEIDADSIPF